MKYYEMNYDILTNTKHKKYDVFVIISLLLFTCLLLFINNVTVINKITSFGYTEGSYLNLEIESILSDAYKNNNILYFNNKKYSYDSVEFIESKIVDDIEYEIIRINIDIEKDKETGKVIVYQKEKIINYIIKLFKEGG